MQWWGYSKEHGWVVLDRSIPSNVPGLKTDLMFLRCRDVMTFMEKRERWTPPGYQYAPNYIRAAHDAEAVTAEFQDLQDRWPEFEREIQRVCREAEERAEALRADEEKAKKQAASEKRKQATAAKASSV